MCRPLSRTWRRWSWTWPGCSGKGYMLQDGPSFSLLALVGKGLECDLKILSYNCSPALHRSSSPAPLRPRGKLPPPVSVTKLGNIKSLDIFSLLKVIIDHRTNLESALMSSFHKAKLTPSLAEAAVCSRPPRPPTCGRPSGGRTEPPRWGGSPSTPCSAA